MAKRITSKDRIKQIFMESDEVEGRLLLELAQLIVEMRHGGKPAEKPKRGRPTGKKTEPPALTAVG